MSYVAHKTRLFRDAGDLPDVIQKRSEGRIKAYPSATDARAWCADTEDRRQHILDLIRADHEKCALGKYVPIEVLIDTLLANKNADIERLRAQVEELQRLLDMYAKLDLTEDQKRILAGMQKQMDKAGAKLDGLAERSSSKTTSPRAAKLAESESETGEETETEDTGGLEPYSTDGLEETAAGEEETTDATDVSEIESSEDGMEKTNVVTESVCAANKAARAAHDARVAARAAELAKTSEVEETPAAVADSSSYDGYSVTTLKSLVISKDAEIISLKNALAAKQAECDQQNKIARSAIEQLETLKDIMEERDSLKKQLKDSLHELETYKNRVEDPCVAEIAELEKEIDRLRNSGQLSPDDEAEVIRKEVEVLKKYCAKLSSIQEENNKLRAQVEQLHELSGIPSGPEDEVEESNDPAELKSKLRDLKRKFAKLNDIMNERDRYKLRAQQLEAELLNYGDLPEEIEMFKQRSQMLDDVLGERDSFQKRLQKVRGIEEELVILKRKADRVDELERMLDNMNAETGKVRRASALEVQSLKSQKDESSRELDSIKAERDMLRMKAADMATVDEELERLRYRAKEAEVLRIERDRMKVRLDELAAIEVEYMQLLDKTRCMETVRAEREMYKQKYEELLGLECECDMLRAQVERFKQLDKEREALLRQVRDCECCIADQEDEIKRLVTHIDRMSQGSHQQQDRMQKCLTEMRAELEEKSCLIATSEEQLAGVQDQLKTTIAGVSCEATCLRARIEELENELEEVRYSLKEKQEEVDSVRARVSEKDELLHSLNIEKNSAERKSIELQQQYSDLEKKQSEEQKRVSSSEELQNVIASKDALIAQLQMEIQKLNDMLKSKSESEKGASDKAASYQSDEHLEKMLRTSKCAVTRVAEELGKHYEEWDCMQGRVSETDSDMLDKYNNEKRLSGELSNELEKLKARIRELEEQLLKANETIAKLREEVSAGDRLSAENKALRRHSTEVQDVAKEQIEELVDHLKQAKERIAQLEAQLGAADNCDELKQQIEALESERNKLKQLVEQFQEGSSDVGSLRMELANLQEQLQKELRLRQGAEEKLQAADERIANLSKELDSLTDNIQEKVRRSSITETEIGAELLKLRAENAQLKENIKSAEESGVRRNSQAAGEMEVLIEQSKQLLKEKVALESENASLNQQLADLKEQLERFKNASGDTAELDALRKENEALKAQLEAQLHKIKESSDTDQAQLDKERKEKEDLQNMIKNLQSQISDMEQSGAVAAERSRSSVDEAIARLTAQLESEQAKASQCENALKKLQEEAKSSPDDSDLLKEQIEMLNGKLKQLETDNEQLSKAAAGDDSVLLSQIIDLKQKIKDLEVENMELKGQLGRMQSELSGVRRMSKAMESDHAVEVKRLSKSYEERMRKSSQSVKMLEEAMNLSAEDQAALQKMKEAYEEHIKSLENELARQRQECEDTIALLKGQSDRELKSLNNKYNDGIAKLQAAHEETLKDINKEHSQEVNNLQGALRTSKEAIDTLEKQKSQLAKSVSSDKASLSVKTVENVDIKPASKASVDAKSGPRSSFDTGKKGVCTCSTGFETILNKILKDGLEALSYEELKYLHSKTCNATAAVLNKHPRSSVSPPAVQSPLYTSRNTSLSTEEDNKLALMRGISGLDGDLMKKQKHAQQKVAALQVAVRMERQRLEELKKTLDVEKQRNSELLCKIGAQSRTVSSLQIERDLMRKQNSFHEEKLHKLRGSVDDERDRSRRLEEDLQRAHQRHKKDTEALEAMRLKLEQTMNSPEQGSTGSTPRKAIPCTCKHAAAGTLQEEGRCRPHQSRTNSFYTELTLPDVRKKRNFVHHCCMKQQDNQGGNDDRSKRSSSVQSPKRRSQDV